MRHVDDGMLHAWLDGEQGVYADEEVRWMRRHLEDCQECAARLEEARALRAEAMEILEGDAADLEGLPSLEELRARAGGDPVDAEPAHGVAGELPTPGGGGGSPRGPVRRGRRLAWAASIVLAAGAGWIANALMDRPGRMVPATELRYLAPMEAGPEPVPRDAEVVARPDALEVEDAPEGAPRSRDAVDPSAPTASPAPGGDDSSIDAAAVGAESPSPAALSDRSLDATASEALDLTADTSVQSKVGEEALVPPVSDTGITILGRLDVQVRGGQTAEVVPQPRAAGQAAPAVEAAPTAEAEPAAERADMAEVLPRDAVPGLEILAVDTLPGPEGIRRIRQRVGPDDVVEVYLLSASHSPEALPEPGADVNQWVVAHRGGWRVLRGRLSLERLQELAERR